jgi:hypothetical protein
LVFWREICHLTFCEFCNKIGTKLPRANAAVCPLPTKADLAEH